MRGITSKVIPKLIPNSKRSAKTLLSEFDIMKNH